MHGPLVDPSSITPYKTDYFPYQEGNSVSEYWKGKFEVEAGKNWDDFYKLNTTNFFKDRHWILREFPLLSSMPRGSTQRKILEVGCGVGNTTFPVLEELPDSFFYSFDFSATAVKLVKANPKYNPATCSAFVLDIVTQELPDFIQPNSIDFVVIIFVLSAISPQHFPSIAQKLAKVVAPGGHVLIRDYGRGDMAATRFEESASCKKIEDNFYVRKDGTRAYYFSCGMPRCSAFGNLLDEMESIFHSAGFKTVSNGQIEKQIENKKQGILMDRIWIQSIFSKE